MLCLVLLSSVVLAKLGCAVGDSAGLCCAMLSYAAE